MPFSRFAACLCCCCALIGAAAEPDDGTAATADAKPEAASGFQPFLLGWDAGDGGRISLDPKEPSVFSGGVVIRYEKITVACESISFWLSTGKGEEKLVERAELVPGQHAHDAQHVLLDSAKSKLATMGFRGTLKPTRVVMDRVREKVDAPNAVRFVIRLEEVGTFSGLLKGKDAWVPVVGWARSADIVLLGDEDGGRLGNLRLSAFHLLGERSDDPTKRQRAWLIELDRTKVGDPAAVDPQPLIAQDADDKARLWSFRQGSTELSLMFGTDGRFTGAQGGQDWTSDGVPSTGTGTERKARLRLDQ